MTKMNTKADLTIVIPVFEEEDNLDRIESEFVGFLNKANFNCDILFVNDGSQDGSQAKIESICQRNESFHFIMLSQNYGLSAAIKAGIDHAQTPYIGYIDADLQTDPEDFNLLMPHASEFPLVTGIRANRKDTFVKNMSSKIANSMRRSITHDGVADTGCPLKVMQAEYAKRIPFFKGLHRFLPAMIILQKGKVKQVEVRHYPRIAGEAKYHLWNRLIGPFADLMAFVWIKRRYINYQIKKQA